MVAELLYLEKQGQSLPIEMLINSSGTTRQDGEIVSGLRQLNTVAQGLHHQQVAVLVQQAQQRWCGWCSVSTAHHQHQHQPRSTKQAAQHS